MTRFRPGQLVEWLHTQRGGYGFSWWVPAVVVRDPGPESDADRRVRIQAKPETGGWRGVTVKAKNLRDAEFCRQEESA